jgi:hypothetical protein
VTEEGDEFVDARRPLFSDYFRAAWRATPDDDEHYVYAIAL